jgi:hypothetical protein
MPSWGELQYREKLVVRELQVSRRSQFLSYYNLNVFCSHFGTCEYNRRKTDPNVWCVDCVCFPIVYIFMRK